MSEFRGQFVQTQKVANEIPSKQLFKMLAMIAEARNHVKLDYLQIFKLSIVDVGGVKKQRIRHSQEVPFYVTELIFDEADTPVEAALFVIDDGSHVTILFRDEY